MTLPRRIRPVHVAAWTVSSACGIGRAAFTQALAQPRCGLRDEVFATAPVPVWIGRIDALDSTPVPPRWRGWDCRPMRLAWLALQGDGFADHVAALRARMPASRIGVVLGTSAATIGVSEEAYRALAPDGGFPPALRDAALNTPHAPARFCAEVLGVEGPVLTVSTACSSSAKAFAVAERWLRLGAADAVVVGGLDALCGSLLHGFSALGLVSSERCRPFEDGRSGISIGEAAGFALLLREGDEPSRVALAGYGESNDAHHMSSPHPQGLGAEAALDDALARAGIDAHDIGYLNLHGTASAKNDEVEAALVARRYAPGVHASATKGITGHSMGAAGIVEAAACWLALEDDLLSGGAEGTGASDPAFGDTFASQWQPRPARRAVEFAASHSFGFGGNNAVLIFGRAAEPSR